MWSGLPGWGHEKRDGDKHIHAHHTAAMSELKASALVANRRGVTSYERHGGETVD